MNNAFVTMTLLAMAAPLAMSATDPQKQLEAELRAEIARLREQAARAEALLQRIQMADADNRPGSAATPPAVAQPAPPPGFNTPPRLPASNADSFVKRPPRLDILLQARYDHFQDRTRNSTFYLRKAEIGLKGHIAPNVDYVAEIDLARTTANDPYRRTYIRFSHLDRLHFKMGMEKAPIGVEELGSTAQVPFVDRSEVTDRFAAAEELGVFVDSVWDRWLFQASVTNGGRRLYRDDNRHKDITGRIVWAPHHLLSIGAATLQGKTGPTEADRIRYQGEIKFGPSHSQGAQAEFYRAKDGRVWSDGCYVAGFWAVPIKHPWFTHIQPVARYEYLDRDDNDRSRELRLLTLGGSLFLENYKAKLQLNWLRDLRRDRPRKDEIRAQSSVEF